MSSRKLAIIFAYVCALGLTAAPATADAAKGGSVRPGPLACDKNDCKERRYWKRKFDALPPADKRWLRSTGECETGGLKRPYRANTGNGYWGRYQFHPRTARAVGFKIKVFKTYKHEQDIRATRLKRREGPGHWPVCGH